MSHSLRRLIAPALAMGVGAPVCGQAPVWLQQFGSPAMDIPWALSADGAGGVFVAGTTEGSLVGPHLGNDDAWLARYDGGGVRAWARQVGSSSADEARAVAPDGAGGAFVGGYSYGLFPADAGWAARYDSTGSLTWLRAISDDVQALLADGAGGVWVAGDEYATGIGSHALLARVDPAGNLVLTTQFGVNQTLPRALAPDGAGGVFVAGYTDTTLAGSSAGWYDAWLARHGGGGNQAWLIQFGTTMGDFPKALAPDGAGGVFIAGYMNDPGPPGDGWLARYDGAGNRLWFRQFGTSGEDQAWALAPDGIGGVFLGGYTLGVVAPPAPGGGDSLLARFDGTGGLAWMRQFGTTAFDGITALALSGSHLFACGPTAGAYGGPPGGAGGNDAWVARLGEFCYPDCNIDGALTVADFGCFQTWFVAGNPYADCNADGQRTVAEFGCFQTKFVTGCP